MQAQYYPGPSPEAVITATPAEFAAMAGRIAELSAAGIGEASFTAAGRGLAAVVVRVGAGPAVVAEADGVLSVSGGPEAVGLFGRNLPAEPPLPGGYHVHFEHAGRESFVAAGSVPLVLVAGSTPDAEPSTAPDPARAIDSGSS